MNQGSKPQSGFVVDNDAVWSAFVATYPWFEGDADRDVRWFAFRAGYFAAQQAKEKAE